MFEFIKKASLELRQERERRALQKQKDIEMKAIHQKKQFEINKTDLEREAELEELKANIRKEQNKSLPKAEQKVPEKKTAFAAFQDYCDGFANQPSMVGDIKFGGESYGKGRHKKGSKRSGTGIGTGFYRI
ncbi:hypothetical protein LCGC14_1710410 [marine sediment metagenome]|uniref:Uncharacterized protein n=1 Tax=marine sediment metagenome TaxID=412755 RepID=A0A0F9HF14_9ZZZZ